MITLGGIIGIRARKIGQVSKDRPLMLTCNHIGWVELFAFPMVMKLSFFGKAEIAKWPLVGWAVKSLGVVFVDRRPSQAMTAVANVNATMKRANYPVALFPEGTTSNGSYVKEFKSSLFSIVNFDNPNITIQPVVQVWKYRNGKLIDDKTLANHYAYFNNDAVEYGPKADINDRSGVALALDIMGRGGLLVDYYFLKPIDLNGIKDRKELAKKLQKIIADKYSELRDNRVIIPKMSSNQSL